MIKICRISVNFNFGPKASISKIPVKIIISNKLGFCTNCSLFKSIVNIYKLAELAHYCPCLLVFVLLSLMLVSKFFRVCFYRLSWVSNNCLPSHWLLPQLNQRSETNNHQTKCLRSKTVKEKYISASTGDWTSNSWIDSPILHQQSYPGPTQQLYSQHVNKIN